MPKFCLANTRASVICYSFVKKASTGHAGTIDVRWAPARIQAGVAMFPYIQRNQHARQYHRPTSENQLVRRHSTTKPYLCWAHERACWYRQARPDTSWYEVLRCHTAAFTKRNSYAQRYSMRRFHQYDAPRTLLRRAPSQHCHDADPLVTAYQQNGRKVRRAPHTSD